MTLAGSKRKFASISSDTETASQPEEQHKPEPRVPKRRKTANTAPKTILKATPVEPPKEHPAATILPPSNPQATLTGLPAELRLQIYSFLCDSTLIHVHQHNSTETPSKPRFTWTPCRSPHPFSPLLCANPKWSGMCPESSRCTYKIHAPPDPIGFWALAASNKWIRNEAQEFFLSKTVVSIHPQNLSAWLDYLAEVAPGQIESLRRVTLAGPNLPQFLSFATMRVLRDRVPNLEGVGIQCQDSSWAFLRSWGVSAPQIRPDAWKSWSVLERVKLLVDASVTVALEAMLWKKKRPRWGQKVEQQVVVRILRAGKEGKVAGGWGDDDVEVEIDSPETLAEPKRNAKWRQWWRGKEMKVLC
ncbi:Nn.00g107230.m01.CDS01 [Neocucurbitaria sp. VM-36]